MDSVVRKAFICLLFILISISVTSVSGIQDVTEFFNTNKKSISWAHRVNSRSKLKLAIDDPGKMMIEADILLGTVNDSIELVPIMAHPPDNSSDLSFQEFLDAIVDANYKRHLRKGMKLDFKDIRIVEPVLRILEEYSLKENALDFPVWLNADVLPGPVSSTRKPVDGDIFLNLTRTYFPTATLSLGWTTRFGRDDIKNSLGPEHPRTIKKGRYSDEDVKNMENLIDKWNIDDWNNGEPPHITFSIRAGLAVHSDGLLALTTKFMDSSFTLWSDVNDPVDMRLLNNTITRIGKELFIDLPFDLATGPTIIPDTKRIVVPSNPQDLSLNGGKASIQSFQTMIITLLNFLVINFLFTR